LYWSQVANVIAHMGTWLFPSDHAQLMLHLAGYFSEKYHGNMVTYRGETVWSGLLLLAPLSGLPQL
ncbi:unnamed protein product, partial [Sphagnum jensenii]